MINTIKLNTKEVLTTGDLHGRFNDISFFVKTYDINESVIIVCGDIGIGFNKPEYIKQTFSKLEKELSKRNVYLLLFRGNHDNPSAFNDDKLNTKHIKLLSDYTVVQCYDLDDIEQKGECFNILVVGGAISIDRLERIVYNANVISSYRKHHKCTIEKATEKALKVYWTDEPPIYNEEILNEIKESGILINAVATHTCPDFCQPVTKDGIASWLEMDSELNDDITNERKIMTQLYDKLIKDEHPLKEWSYGHYHFHKMEYINNIRFVLLDMAVNGKLDFVTIKKF